MLQLTNTLNTDAVVYVVNEQTSIDSQFPQYIQEAFKNLKEKR